MTEIIMEQTDIAGLNNFVDTLFINKYIPISSLYLYKPGRVLIVSYQEMMQFFIYWRDLRLKKPIYRYYTLDEISKTSAVFAVTTNFSDTSSNLIVPKLTEYKVKTVNFAIPVEKTVLHVPKRLVRRKYQSLEKLFSYGSTATEFVEASSYTISTMNTGLTKISLKMALTEVTDTVDKIYAENSTFIKTVLNK